MNILLLGAGGHAKAVVEAVRASGHRLVAYVDPAEAGWLRAEHIADDGAAEAAHPGAGIVLGIGGVTPDALERRMDIFDRHVGAGRSAPPVVHPGAMVSGSAAVDAGVILLAGTVIQPGASLGLACLINSGAIVEHDATVGAGAHVAPGAIVLGGATVGVGAMIGAGAVILPGAVVPDGAFVKALERYPGAAGP